MAKAQEVLYALVGAGDFTMQKVKDLSKIDAKSSQEIYEDFVKRGKSLSTKVRNSASTKRAVEQTRTAQTQVKAAATSVGKAIKVGARQGPSKAAGQTKAARTRVKAATTSVGKAVKANAKATRTAVKAS
jgi:superfamily II RNA helicase